MRARFLESIHLKLALAAALSLAPPGFADDVSVTLDAGTGFSIQNRDGSAERLRIEEATGNFLRNGKLFIHSTGANNLFVGEDAGNPTTGGIGGNLGFGYRALATNTTGAQNLALGSDALVLNTTGNDNIAIGSWAGQNQTTGSDNIYLANPGVAGESNRIRIGLDALHAATFIAGIRGTDVGGGALPVYVNSNGQLGTSGGSQTTWTGDVNASDFDLTGVRRLAFGAALESGGGFNLDMPNTTGYGFTIATAEPKMSGGIGVARDTTATIGFNWNEGGTNFGTPFNPYFGLSFESNFPTAAWPADTVQEFHIIAGSGRTAGNVANGAGFAPGQVIVVEEPGDGPTVGIGKIKSISGGAPATLVIDWIYSGEAATNPPTMGDTMERESSTTVTNRVGTFSMTGGGLWVYPSPVCGSNESTATAILGISSVSNQAGTTADLVWVRSSGSGTDLVPGNCVRQSLTGATAQLGVISVAASTILTSAPIATGDGSWRPMSTIFAPYGQAMTSAWYTNRAVQDSGVPTLVIGSTTPGQSGHWLGIATNLNSAGGNDYVGAIGSPSADANFGIWGRWWIFEPGTYDHVSLGATGVSGTRMQDFADVDGTIAAFTNLVGCADGAPVLASGSSGGVKCGTPQVLAVPLALDFAADLSEDPPEETAPMLWKKVQEQQETIAAQARLIETVRQQHQRDVAGLTKRLARLESQLGDLDRLPRRTRAGKPE